MVAKFRERHKPSYIVCANVFTITLEIRACDYLKQMACPEYHVERGQSQ